MSAAGSPAAQKARRYLNEIESELLRLLESAPAYGSASIGMTFHDSEITSLDLSASVKRRLQGGSR
jgi:hypothetical protein